MNSRRIVSNQQGVHPKLRELLEKHRRTHYRKPIARHTAQAFEHLQQAISEHQRPLIFDSGCGTGESTIMLAKRYPEHFVIGLDKSALRLRKAEGKIGMDSHVLFLRCDLFDLWRLAAQAGIRVDRHYLLYPNPWPRKEHVMRRYHGHPVFFDLLRLGRYFEMRSNWKIYIDEFALAFYLSTGVRPEVSLWQPEEPISNFEKKYRDSGHDLYRLTVTLM